MAPRETNAERAKFCKVGKVFVVEGCKIISTEGLSEGGGEGGGSKVALEGGIGGEIGSECRGGGVGGVGRGFIKAEVTKWGSVVSKGASSSELAGRAEGVENISVGESERCGGSGVGAGTARRGTVRWLTGG